MRFDALPRFPALLFQLRLGALRAFLWPTG